MSLPIAIIDKRAPQKAIEKLQENFEVFEFISKDLTYPSIAGHPDIFITEINGNYILAPNSPKDLVELFKKHKISFTFGAKNVGKDVENSTQYNCIVRGNTLFHKQGFTDETITKNITKTIKLPQAYTRCNMFALPDKSCITSDMGIHKSLQKNNIESHYFSSESILLPPHKNGCIGGILGIFENKLHIIGSLKNIPDGKKIQKLTSSKNIELIELYDGNLYDGGGIFFLESKY